jgi:hypothetical protein
MNVRVANAAKLDVDQNIVIAQIAAFEIERNEFCIRVVGSVTPCFYHFAFLSLRLICRSGGLCVKKKTQPIVAMTFNSIAIGVGSELISTVVRHG